MDQLDARDVDGIEGIRIDTNALWMDILRIALTHAPTETRKVMAQIATNDARVREATMRIADRA